MPYINIKSNFKINKEAEEKVKAKLGQAISIIPGKREASLMLGFEYANMYFRGQELDKILFVEVKLYGKADRTAMNELTAEICTIFNEELSVPKDCIYVKYEEVEVWGCNGYNF